MGKLGGCLLLENFPSCRSQPHQPEAVRQVWAATPENSRCKTSSTNQSEKQTLTLAEIKVHVMFVVSNLWISFEKQSAWKTDEQLGHKGTEKPGLIHPQKGCCPTDLEHPFGGLLPKRQGACSGSTYHLTRGRKSLFLLKDVLSLPAAFPLIWCSVPPPKAVLHTIHSQQELPPLHVAAEERGISRTVKLAPGSAKAT